MIEQGRFWKPYRRDSQFQSRGRWANSKSVLRYAKTFVYAKADAEVPDHLRALGKHRRRAAGLRPEVALG